ncbi:hypothetical protein E2320_008078, partial [Naja naja]
SLLQHPDASKRFIVQTDASNLNQHSSTRKSAFSYNDQHYYKNLHTLQQTKLLLPRQVRWSQFFSSFDFYIMYVPGSKNLMPDVLFRKMEYSL